MTLAKAKKDLVQIIRDNPGCVVQVDNDHWDLFRESPDCNPHDFDESESSYEKWEKDNLLVSADDDFQYLGDNGYGSGNCYGGDILQALAIIVGIKVESV
jgi:hypothetical protein